jgi:hypothetical protein
MLILAAPIVLVLVAALVAIGRPWWRARRYAKLLEECLDRQPGHELEHGNAHGGQFTNSLRVEAIARRFERKIHAAKLPPLSAGERRRRAKEALCRPE